jgi:NAD(P)-dependent dehydrogenase (short-subunit alcohol dehydrogenase family)
MADVQSVVVTGISTGIGWGITKVLIANGFTVFGSVRRQSDADRLQHEFGEAFTPLIMDVTDRQAVERAAAQVSAQLGSSTLAGLVNNAGVAVPGPLLHLPLEEYRRQLEVNLLAPLSLTQVFAPLLGADLARRGRPDGSSTSALPRERSVSRLWERMLRQNMDWKACLRRSGAK